MPERIKIIKEDITKLKVEAIVNAANKSLLGGGGVDGAIHKAAGPDLLKECMILKGCDVGEAKITKGYNLFAKWIIHAVGPVWQGGKSKEQELLANCYKNSLKITQENNIKTIAFPCISTGVYHFPKGQAAEVAINEIKNFLKNNKTVESVTFVCFDDENFRIYQNLLSLQ
jgi:O-acetyl-ADP-ribose deacetylase (regulator of RNase III)